MQVSKPLHTIRNGELSTGPAHRAPLDLQTVYVEKEDLQCQDGRRRISQPEQVEAGGQFGPEPGERGTQREGDAAIAVRSPSSGHLL
jgi:hypothetical protein